MSKKAEKIKFGKVEYIDDIIPDTIETSIQWALDQGFSKEQILTAIQRDIPHHLEKAREILTNNAQR